MDGGPASPSVSVNSIAGVELAVALSCEALCTDGDFILVSESSCDILVFGACSKHILGYHRRYITPVKILVIEQTDRLRLTSRASSRGSV